MTFQRGYSLYGSKKKSVHAWRANLVICNECFWCASQIGSELIDNCPSCGKSKLDKIPISLDEAYLFDYDDRRGVNLSFWKETNAASRLVSSERLSGE